MVPRRRGWFGQKFDSLSLRLWLHQFNSRLKLQLHRKPLCLNGGNNETALSNFEADSRPLRRGVAETLVKIPKARGTRIETFILIKPGSE